MSGEPKTLWEMTPREAWEVAWEQAIDTARVVMEEEAFAKQLEAMRNLARQFIDQEPVGVRVVARDEANELRAALEQIAEGAPLTMPTSLVARKHWELATIAREALRRLAGGENER